MQITLSPHQLEGKPCLNYSKSDWENIKEKLIGVRTCTLMVEGDKPEYLHTLIFLLKDLSGTKITEVEFLTPPSPTSKEVFDYWAKELAYPDGMILFTIINNQKVYYFK